MQFLQKLKQDSLAGKQTMASAGMFNKDYGKTGCEVFTVGLQNKVFNCVSLNELHVFFVIQEIGKK